MSKKLHKPIELQLNLPKTIRNISYLKQLSDIPCRLIAMYIGTNVPIKEKEKNHVELLWNPGYYSIIQDLFILRKNYNHIQNIIKLGERKGNKLERTEYFLYDFALYYFSIFRILKELWIEWNHTNYNITDNMLVELTDKFIVGINSFDKWKTRSNIRKLHNFLYLWLDKIYVRSIAKPKTLRFKYKDKRDQFGEVLTVLFTKDMKLIDMTKQTQVKLKLRNSYRYKNYY